MHGKACLQVRDVIASHLEAGRAQLSLPPEQVHHQCGSAELGTVKLVMEKQIAAALVDFAQSTVLVENQHRHLNYIS